MGNIWLLKRALPFLGTFAFGLFIASFFVSISPGFEHHERGRWHHDMWELRIENEQLRDENRQLRKQLDSARERTADSSVYFEYQDQKGELPLGDENAPPPPKRLKQHNIEVR